VILLITRILIKIKKWKGSIIEFEITANIILEKSIVFCVCIVFMSVILAFSTYSQNIILPKELIGSLLLLLSFLLAIIYCIENQILNISDFFIKIPTIFLLLIILFSSINSDYKFRTSYFAEHYILIVFQIIVMVSFINTIGRFKLLLNILNLTTFVAGIYYLLQVLNIDFVEWGFNTAPLVSTFGTPLGTTFYFPTMLIISIISIFFLKKNILSILTIITSIIVLIFIEKGCGALVMRGIISGAFFLIIIFFIEEFKSFILLVNYLHFWFFPANYYFRNLRLAWWKGNISMIVDSPILGYGPGTFQLIFPKYRNANYHRYGMSHNSLHSMDFIIETFSDFGLLGGSIFFMVILLAIYNLGYIMEKSGSKKNYYIAALFIACFIVFYFSNFGRAHSKWFCGVFFFFYLIGVSQIWCERFYFKNIETPQPAIDELPLALPSNPLIDDAKK